MWKDAMIPDIFLAGGGETATNQETPRSVSKIIRAVTRSILVSSKTIITTLIKYLILNA